MCLASSDVTVQTLRVCDTSVCLYGRETVGSTNNKNKEGGQKKDERPKERGWDAMQPNKKTGEKQDEMGWPLGKDGCRQTSKESLGGKTSRMQERATAEKEGLREEGYEKIGGG